MAIMIDVRACAYVH